MRPFGGRVKIVEPAGVKPDFGGRSFVFTNDPSLGEYQPLVRAFVETMSYRDPSTPREPAEVAEAPPTNRAPAHRPPRLAFV